MPRPRAFDTDAVVTTATTVFTEYGYNGASMDQLLAATGIRRASLYNAFGSKRGLFLSALRAAAVPVDLVVVALMDLAPADPAVRAELAALLDARGLNAHALGEAVLRRAGIEERGQG
ncbi:TetR/AcrR family transcriptional regulator [Williamsia sterculiae]|uniref:Transcriptional regulator, TetR family n=1 Tax=Williamsia sterculiae TaxID=1344003 RepID=A0A1N7H221_9NOCA|nr:TetR family transcriptional regulator [Williamsia sterculiae]SIS18728.1 transcriptional regulator, TetR family [Williamsia sterculiae]